MMNRLIEVKYYPQSGIYTNNLLNKWVCIVRYIKFIIKFTVFNL
jgi:hypothetical protein